jgi:cell division protein FtsW (lipid II flippase)
VAFQPAEPLKLLLVLFFAGYLADTQSVLLRRPAHWAALPYLIPLLLMWSLGVAFLILQRDLGTAILLFGSFVILLYLATGRTHYALAGVAGVVGAAWLGLQAIPLVQQRVDIWLDPLSYANDEAYQVMQGFITIASGALEGRGLGFGMPEVVPAAHTDFVFAAISEELGLFGASGVLCCYLLLLHRGFRIALDARYTFGRFLAAGSTVVLALQALIILGGNLGLLPLTGLTLPFISYGGSSLVTNMVLVGFILVASRSDAVPASTRLPAPRLEARASAS